MSNNYGVFIGVVAMCQRQRDLSGRLVFYHDFTDSENLAELPVEMTDSNFMLLRDNLSDGAVIRCNPFESRPVELSPQVIQQMITRFEYERAADLKELDKMGIEFAVKFMVVPWAEY